LFSLWISNWLNTIFKNNDPFSLQYGAYLSSIKWPYVHGFVLASIPLLVYLSIIISLACCLNSYNVVITPNSWESKLFSFVLASWSIAFQKNLSVRWSTYTLMRTLSCTHMHVHTDLEFLLGFCWNHNCNLI
jgi:hypothetical protein